MAEQDFAEGRQKHIVPNLEHMSLFVDLINQHRFPDLLGAHPQFLQREADQRYHVRDSRGMPSTALHSDTLAISVDTCSSRSKSIRERKCVDYGVRVFCVEPA